MGRSAGGCPPCSSNDGESRRGKSPDGQAKSLTQRLVPVPWACHQAIARESDAPELKYMPPIGVVIPDDAAVALIKNWIDTLSP